MSPIQSAGPEDAQIILRLYELRRDERMREAREFMFRQYAVESIEDHGKLCPAGSRNDASFRMVVAYWEMACTFVMAGILNEELLIKNSGELLQVWARIEPVVPAIRRLLKDPEMWNSFEVVAKSGIAEMNRKSPGAWEARLQTIWRIRSTDPAAA